MAKISFDNTAGGTNYNIKLLPNMVVIAFFILMALYVVYAGATVVIDAAQGHAFSKISMLMLLFPAVMFFVITSVFRNDLPPVVSFIDNLLDGK